MVTQEKETKCLTVQDTLTAMARQQVDPMQPGMHEDLDFPSALAWYGICMWFEICHHSYHYILRTYGGELCPGQGSRRTWV